MIVREATYEEIPALLEMARMMHAESDYGPVPFEDEMCQIFLEIVVNETDHVALVAVKDNEIVGAFLGAVVPYFFSRQLRVSDITLYVLPEHRGSSAAYRLDQAAEAWGESKGAVRNYRGITTNNPKADAFYKKMGYDCIGGFYRKEGRSLLSTPEGGSNV